MSDLTKDQVLEITRNQPDGFENQGDTEVWTVWQSGNVGDTGADNDKVQCYVRLHNTLNQLAITYPSRGATGNTDYFDL